MMMSVDDGAQDVLPLRLDGPLILPLVPSGRRHGVATLWQLEAKLSALAVGGREPALRQIKLRWWHDQLAGLTAQSAPPDPLLQAAADHLLPFMTAPQIASIASAWEADVITAADGQPDSVEHGSTLFQLSAAMIGGAANTGGGDTHLADAGRGWAALRHAARSDAADTAASFRHADQRLQKIQLSSLPRSLAALTGLARSIARADGNRRRGWEQMVILRIGLFGR